MEDIKAEGNLETQSAVIDNFDYNKQIHKMNVHKLGLLLANLSIFSVFLLIFGVVGQIAIVLASALFMMIIFLVWLSLTIITIGIIYLVIPNFSNILNIAKNTGEFISKLQLLFNKFALVLPIGLGVSLVAGVISLILLNKVSPNQHKAKKVFVIISMVLSVIIGIFIFVGVLGGAK